jgi:hypothetical protein
MDEVLEDDSFSKHRKMNRSKKWSKVFTESVTTRAPIVEKETIQRGEGVAVYFAKTAVAKKLHSLAKIKLYERSFTCRRTIENLKPPSELVFYRPHWKVSTLCDICMKPALSDSIICNFCDIIVHIGCHEISPEESAFVFTPKTNAITPKALTTPKNNLLTPKKTPDPPGTPKITGSKLDYSKILVCKNCRETQREEEKLHHVDYEKVCEERRLHLFGKYLSKIVYTHVTRRNYLRQKQGITKIQSILRGYFMRKRFLQFRRRSLRVLHMQPTLLPKLDSKSMLIFTIFDNVKNVQLFRLDRQCDRMSEEGFIIPGIATSVNFVLTLVTLEGQHHLIVGQASFSLRDVDPYQVQEITFTLSGNIVWPPLESREEKILFDLSSDRASNPHKVFKFRYTPIHPVLSMVATTTAPPLDILRRPVESYMISSHSAMNATSKAKERTSRWFICLAELKLVFYQFMGDSKQRYAVNIRDTTVAVSKEELKTVIVNFGDRKKWLINFSNPGEAKKFAFTVNESKKALDGSSIYFKSSGVPPFVYNQSLIS